jgi:type IX secretion system substrate protein
MKKIVLTFAAATSLLNAGAQVQRTVLYQEFTGENCGPCAAYNPGLESLMSTNKGKIIHVTNMEPIPSTGVFYQSQMALNDACFHYYDTYWTALMEEFTPSGMLDGRMPDSVVGGVPGNVGNFVQNDITYEYPKSSPIYINASHYFTAAHDSVYGKVEIKAASNLGGKQLKLRVAFVKTMNFATPPGDNGESHFENVARAMFPSQSGQLIATAWTPGTMNTYTYAGKITGLDGTLTGITVVDSNLVVWVQNDSTASGFNVLQAAYSIYSPKFASLGVNSVGAPTFNLDVYPNPAKESATLSFSLTQASEVQVKVIDQLGRTYTTITQKLTEGGQKIELPTNELPGGVYMVQMQVNDVMVTQRLAVIK